MLAEDDCTGQVCSFCLLSQPVAPSKVVIAVDIEVAAETDSRKMAGALAGTGNFERKDSFVVDCWLGQLGSSMGSSVAVVTAAESAVERRFGRTAMRKGTGDAVTVLEDFGRRFVE